MKAQQTRAGGRHVFIERGGVEIEAPVQKCTPAPAALPETAPLRRAARFQGSAIVAMASICGLSAKEFAERYA